MSSESPELTVQQRTDILLNRTNIALARSQRLIQSWLPARPPNDGVPAATSADDEDEDFKSMSERAGVGSKDAHGDDTSLLGATRRNKLSSNDKLLEQLIGKKAAQQKRRDDAEKKASAETEQKDLRRTIKSTDPESDDEEGRAAVFKSRKSNNAVKQSVATNDAKHAGSINKVFTPHHAKSDSETESRPQKRRVVSYLDEVMSKKAKKKSKNQHG